MSPPATYVLRLVIQRVRDGGNPPVSYRVVAYPPPKGLTLRPAKFFSREQLLERLQSVLPDLDQNLQETVASTQIAFAGDVQLSKAQLVALGIVR